MTVAEIELRRITEEYRRLREDLLPVFRMAKEGQPLPYHPPAANGQSYNQQTSYNNLDGSTIISPPAPPPSLGRSSNGIARKNSTKQLIINPTPKNASPTHPTQNAQDRFLMEQALDPAAAAERAVLSSSHLAAMNGGSQSLSSPSQSPNIPSPTSPPTNSSFSGSTLVSQSYRPDIATPSGRNTFSPSDTYTSYNTRDSMKAPSRRAPTPAIDQSANNSAGSVEIFKSFRVGMEDPCWKVLPAALKKYNINAPWENYALFIVYGDQERCLELSEKPLILFKQLDKEGKKPMFMLRKTNVHPDAVGAEIPGSAGLDGGLQFQRGPSGRTQGVTYNPPGGII
jgi:protein STE50